MIDRGGLERDGPLDGGDASEGDGAALRARDDASTVEAVSARDVGMEEIDPELRPGRIGGGGEVEDELLGAGEVGDLDGGRCGALVAHCREAGSLGEREGVAADGCG